MPSTQEPAAITHRAVVTAELPYFTESAEKMGLGGIMGNAWGTLVEIVLSSVTDRVQEDTAFSEL